MADYNKKIISIIVPIYNEQEIINEFYRRLKAVLDNDLSGYGYEIIYINDGSKDNSLELLLKLRSNDQNIKIINFSRNFGHQLAVTAGIDSSIGDIVVLIDSDLQDPPELIPKMIEKWNDGFQVVYGQRIKRKGESIFKLATAKIFYRMINALSDVKLPVDTGDFRLMDKQVVDYLKQLREECRYIRGLVTWVGYKQTPIYYERDKRYSGETKYPIRKMIKFATNGLTSFSERPLFFAGYFGLIITLLTFIYVGFLIVEKFVSPHNTITGWTSLIIAVLFFGGVQLMSLGIIGQYIGRIYREIKNRPLYVINGKFGFNGEKHINE